MASRPAAMSASARRTVEDPANDRFVSIASIWEITIKVSLGKLTLPGRLEEAVESLAAAVLPIALSHIRRVELLPFHHRDPFDRMLVGQAMEEGLTIVSRDRRLSAYGVPLLVA